MFETPLGERYRQVLIPRDQPTGESDRLRKRLGVAAQEM
jgi:hypothetical protein